MILHLALAAIAYAPIPPMLHDAIADANTIFRASCYYIVDEKDYKHLEIDDELLDMKDRALARVSAKFKKDLKMEGTGRLLDGRIVNFSGFKKRDTRFMFTKHPFGNGVGSCALRPFRTLAVNPKMIPLGSKVLIKETVGMKLPNGKKHDGVWYAQDVGGSIKGNMVDMFVGEKSGMDMLIKAGIGFKKPLTIRIIARAPEKSCVNP